MENPGIDGDQPARFRAAGLERLWITCCRPSPCSSENRSPLAPARRRRGLRRRFLAWTASAGSPVEIMWKTWRRAFLIEAALFAVSAPDGSGSRSSCWLQQVGGWEDPRTRAAAVMAATGCSSSALAGKRNRGRIRPQRTIFEQATNRGEGLRRGVLGEAAGVPEVAPLASGARLATAASGSALYSASSRLPGGVRAKNLTY